jgi:membrane protein required for colicin V production
MNGFDWTVIGVFGLSMLFAFLRGVTRELIALVSWVAGFVAAVTLSPMLGGLLPEIAAWCWARSSRFRCRA